MSISVLRPGALSTFQDPGRYGYQHLGVPVCGAMDQLALALANVLVGNPAPAPALELTLTGPALQFDKATCIAISGADLGANLDDEPLAPNRPYLVAPRQVLRFGARRHGARAYLAWHGGPALHPVLGSYSTCLGTAFGGLEGRALRAGDRLAVQTTLDPAKLPALRAGAAALKLYLPSALVHNPHSAIRVLPQPASGRRPGPLYDELLAQPWNVDAASNRMGYRLRGEALDIQGQDRLLSTAVSAGTIQLPPDGQPIVLMADRQTSGGYTRLGAVATADLPQLAQYMPGDAISFQACSLEEARAALNRRARALDSLKAQLTDWTQALHNARIGP